MFIKIFSLFAAIAAVSAQRPDGTSMCDYYTSFIFSGNNTAENQYELVKLVVNTAVIGNYTKPNLGIAVPGILAPGTFNGSKVTLAPFFNGGLASTNRGGNNGTAVNFLDGGGAAPLKLNRPAEDMYSNQYTLLTHLYEFFGVLLGCSQMGTAQYPQYDGQPSMYEVHKYMGLGPNEVGYFNQQVGLALTSFNVSRNDTDAVNASLNKLFNVRCAPPVAIGSTPANTADQTPVKQSICIADNCPLAENSNCDGYAKAVRPAVVNETLVANTTFANGGSSSSSSMTSTATGTATRSSVSMLPTGTRSAAGAEKTAGAGVGMGVAVVGGLFAMLL